MKIFEWTLFIFYKPFVLYVFGPMIFVDFNSQESESKILVLLSFILGAVFIVVIEKAMQSRKYVYKPIREVEVSKVFEIMGRYLSLDYSSVQIFKKSIRGKLVRKGFQDEFKIQEKGGLYTATITGNFPFPISILNRLKISNDIEKEFRSHGIFRA